MTKINPPSKNSRNSPCRTLPIKLAENDSIYDCHKPFGSAVKGGKIIGEKYKFEPSKNPPPGAYDVQSSSSAVKPRSLAMARMSMPSNKQLSPCRTLDVLATQGSDFVAEFKPFGSDAPSFKINEKIPRLSPTKSRAPDAGTYNVKDDFVKPKAKGGPYISAADDYEERNFVGAASMMNLSNMTDTSVNSAVIKQAIMRQLEKSKLSLNRSSPDIKKTL